MRGGCMRGGRFISGESLRVFFFSFEKKEEREGVLIGWG